MIITKTPFRMSFFGGGTDMESFFKEYGGSVLSTTFDKYCYVNVRHLPRFFDYSTELSYSKTERVTDVGQIQHPAIRNAMKMLEMYEIRLTYVLKLGDMRWLYTEGAGLWWQCRYIAVGECVCNLVLNVLLVRHLGVFGIIFGTLVSLVVVDNILGTRIVFDNYFKKSQNEYLLDHLKYFGATTVIATIIYIICGFVPGGGLISLTTKGLLCAILSGIGYYLIYRNTEMYSDSVGWMRNSLKQLSN